MHINSFRAREPRATFSASEHPIPQVVLTKIAQGVIANLQYRQAQPLALVRMHSLSTPRMPLEFTSASMTAALTERRSAK
jgi:hypothetical protein